jgi:hypothetical protein
MRKWDRIFAVASIDQEFIAAVFVEQLTTSAARRQRLTISRDDRSGAKTAAAVADQVAYQRTLGTKGESVARVLDVGSNDEAPVGRDGGGANSDV